MNTRGLAVHVVMAVLITIYVGHLILQGEYVTALIFLSLFMFGYCLGRAM